MPGSVQVVSTMAHAQFVSDFFMEEIDDGRREGVMEMDI